MKIQQRGDLGLELILPCAESACGIRKGRQGADPAEPEAALGPDKPLPTGRIACKPIDPAINNRIGHRLSEMADAPNNFDIAAASLSL